MLKHLIPGGIVGLACAAAVLALWSTGVLDRLENATWSWRVATFAPRSQPHPQIKVILLDQASLEWGQKENGWAWPWPRTVYVPLLDFCKRGGAKCIAFDVLLTEPSAYGASDDLALGEAVRRSRGFVGTLALGSQVGATTNWPARVPVGPLFSGLESWLDRARAGSVVVPRATFPIPEVATNATLLANVSDLPDADAQFRRGSLFRVFDGTAVPGLGLGAFLAGEQRTGQSTHIGLKEGCLEIGTRKVPIDRTGRAILSFYGKTGTHQTFSAAAVIQSELRVQAGEKPVLSPQIFENAYVFFGFSAPGLMDLRPTPLSRVYPGVEIHATCLENLLTNSFLRSPPPWTAALGTLLLGVLSGALVTLGRKVRHTVLVFAFAMLVPVLAAFAAYPLGWWWPLVGPEIAVGVALVGGIVLNYATEGRQKTFLKRAFKHYLGAEVIEQIIADPGRLQLGGEKRDLTLFFSDIEKFSSFSEKLDPETLTKLLNEYLTDMTDIILEEGGYLDKYIGDAIVAFWNAPVAQPDHTIRAVRALLRCQRRLAERRAHYLESTGVCIRARIGMNTGEVTVGNMGSRDRFNYTVLGDAANLASRLEGANKAFGTYNLVSESTWVQTSNSFIGRELGRLKVVGREKPVQVFEVLGLAGEPVPEFAADFENGYKLCLESRWREALDYFERHQQDPPSAAYATFCKKKLSVAVQQWDGIWSLTEK